MGEAVKPILLLIFSLVPKFQLGNQRETIAFL